MGFHLKQYIQADTDNDNKYMTLITDENQTATTLQKANDDVYGFLFNNQCVKRTSKFKTGTAYYFHGKIQRLPTPQEFTVKLTNDASYQQQDYANQYIRAFTINAINPDSEIIEDRQYDIEFIFIPFIDDYNTIIFELTRETIDLNPETTRTPIIGYEEISEINNMKSTFEMSENYDIVKLGIQARPSSILCLNKEGIRVPVSGVQELRDGSVPVDFISFVASAVEDSTTMQTQMDSVEQNPKAVTSVSKCFFNEDKKRPIKAFAIDYIYDDKL